MHMRKRSVFVCSLLCVVLSCVNADRTEVPFSYGWRFKFGHEPDAGPGPNSCTNFDKNVTGMTCTNMNDNPNRFTLQDCARSCCYRDDCYVYQMAGRGCIQGGKDAVCSAGSSSAYVGAQRSSVLPKKTQYTRAGADFDDSDWDIVDAPHDGLMSTDNAFVDSSDVFHGFRSRNVTWYRKHFQLPSGWKGKHIYLYFEGVFHYTQIWLNGQFIQTNTAGYTSFTVRLDNVTALSYTDKNVLAVRADATYGSGHWYEGGGLYRHVSLVGADMTHFVQDGVFVWSQWDGKATIPVVAEVEALAGADVPSSTVKWALMDGDKELASLTSATFTIKGSGTTMVTGELDISSAGVKLWSVQSPTTYTVTTTLNGGVDSVVTPAGFRGLEFTGDKGFFLNGQPVKYRGFSHHNSFGGVGTALTQRMYLFRAQATRAMGGNIWRNSHNPYTPRLYPILNELGILNWDENRDYGPWYVQEMHNMVKRDRNHPAIIIFAFCNEYECKQATNYTGLAFRNATRALDTSRPTGANQSPGGLTVGIDVHGFSHQSNKTFIAFHEANPDTPTVLSECCSCTSQRPDRSIPTCIREQNSPLELPYVLGSLGVWTLMDYYGESHTWPQVSSPYGQFDIAGFPKSHAMWYQANWLDLYPTSDAGRPPLPVRSSARIINLADQPDTQLTSITSTADAELIVDGNRSQKQSGTPGYPMTWQTPRNTCVFSTPLNNVQCHGLQRAKTATSTKECSAACCADKTCTMWQYVADQGCWIGAVSVSTCTPSTDPWQGGAIPGTGFSHNATLNALASDGSVVATHTIFAPGPPAGVTLDIDVPSPLTGTGNALLLDGSDTALLRVTMVGANGNLVSTSSANVTFEVVSGPGRVFGIANGDPALQTQPHASTVSTYLGLARGFVQVTWDCTTPNRDIASTVDVDGNKRTIIKADGDCAATPIVVKVTAGSLGSATVSILVSSDVEKDSPVAVAKANVNLDTWAYTTIQA